MTNDRVYEVLLLPGAETAERFASLREAHAWMRAYNQAGAGRLREAVVGERALASRDCRRRSTHNRQSR